MSNNKPAFRLPTVEDRTLILGHTGSGKSHFGAWLLSEAPFHRQPFVVIDFKREPIFAAIGRRRPITVREVPVKPGLYHLSLLPHQVDDLEAWLWKVWEKGGIGLFFDEGYLVPDNSNAWKAILVSGRSKKIPVITLSQRPVALPRWTVSESSFFHYFHLIDQRDRDVLASFTPQDGVWGEEAPLSRFWSKWYDVGARQAAILTPAPPKSHILARFDQRLTPPKQVV